MLAVIHDRDDIVMSWLELISNVPFVASVK